MEGLRHRIICLQRDTLDPGIRLNGSKEVVQFHYLRCGSERTASKLVALDPSKRIAKWCHEGSSCVGLQARISKLCTMGELEKATDMLLRLDERGNTPSLEMYMSLLKECSKRRALAQARRVRFHLAKRGLESIKFLGEYVVRTLVMCGGLHDAIQLFQTLPQRTSFSWTSLISGYTDVGQVREALRTYYRMQHEGVPPSTYTFVSLLKACGIFGNLDVGKRIHAEASKYDCDSDLIVGTCLVCMYSKCGSVMDAQDVFDGLSQRDGVSWNAIMLAYVKQGQPEKALHLYEQMLEEAVRPSEWTFVTVLQACGMLAEKDAGSAIEQSKSSKYLKVGKVIHAEILRKCYHLHSFISNTLISMYGKCRSILDARYEFDMFYARDVVSWTAILSACIQQTEAETALELYELMLKEGSSPSDRIVVCVLQACGMLADKEEDDLASRQRTKLDSLSKVKEVHAYFHKKGSVGDVYVRSSLVTTYSKCGSMLDVQNVFDGCIYRDVVLWNALLNAHTQRGHEEKILLLYEQMVEEGVSPDVRSYVCALGACGLLCEQEQQVLSDAPATKYLQMGRALHVEAWRRGCTSDVFVGTALISLYGKCRSAIDARNVLDAYADQHVVLLNAMLSAHLEQGDGHNLMDLYIKMQNEGISPDFRTIVSVLQACGILAVEENDMDISGKSMKVQALHKVRAVHADAWRRGYQADIFIGNALVNAYGKCGSIADAHIVFAGLSQRSVVSWNTMLVAHVKQGQAEISLDLFEHLLEEGIRPDNRTFVCALQACALLAGDDASSNYELSEYRALEKGKVIHAFACSNCDEADAFVANALICMYSKCRSLTDAQEVFTCLSQRDLVSWNAMLSAYVERAESEMAWQLYRTMLEEGLSPDGRTFVSMLQICMPTTGNKGDSLSESSTGVEALGILRVLHAFVRMKGYEANAFVGNTLVCMYGRLGSILDAESVFDDISQRDVASWNAMLSAYVEQGYAEEALLLYSRMAEEGMSANEITLLCILRACSSIGNLDGCRQIHHDLVHTKANLSPLMATALVHAYGRCASMVHAQGVFDLLPQPNLVSWNALIAGYARQGDSAASLLCYKQMQQQGTKPNAVTFLSLLSACSHAGLLERGVEYLTTMTKDYGLTPKIEHYATMVDLLGRAGHFAEIEDLLLTMPVQPDLGMWLGLLAACRKHGKVRLGKQAFDGAVCLQRQHAAAYVLMFNLYADAGLWDRAVKVVELKRKACAWKTPGQSWIQHKQETRRFLVADCRSSQHEELYDILNQVIVKLNEDHNKHV